jgi:dolichyldiphosphatase
MAGTAKVAFDLTFVEYERGDVVGFLCAGLSLAPVFGIVAYVSVVIARREFITIVALLGQLANTAFNVALKHLLAHERPQTSGVSGPGMPSNHSQFVFFTAAFWALHAYNTSAVQFNTDTAAWRAALYRHLIAFSLVAAATGVAFSRVYLGYHYIDQVVVGSAAGLATGLAWCVCRPACSSAGTQAGGQGCGRILFIFSCARRLGEREARQTDGSNFVQRFSGGLLLLPPRIKMIEASATSTVGAFDVFVVFWISVFSSSANET